MSTSTESIFVNGEVFTKTTFNGISIIIRVKDDFINAGKLCVDNGKDFYEIRRGKRWGEILKKMNEKY